GKLVEDLALRQQPGLLDVIEGPREMQEVGDPFPVDCRSPAWSNRDCGCHHCGSPWTERAVYVAGHAIILPLLLTLSEYGQYYCCLSPNLRMIRAQIGTGEIHGQNPGQGRPPDSG